MALQMKQAIFDLYWQIQNETEMHHFIQSFLDWFNSFLSISISKWMKASLWHYKNLFPGNKSYLKDRAKGPFHEVHMR